MVKDKIRKTLNILGITFLAYQLIFHVGVYLIYHDEIYRYRDEINYVADRIQLPRHSTEVTEFNVSKMLYDYRSVSFKSSLPDAQVRQALRETIKNQGFYELRSNSTEIVFARHKDKVRCFVEKSYVNKSFRWYVHIYAKDWPIGTDIKS